MRVCCSGRCNLGSCHIENDPEHDISHGAYGTCSCEHVLAGELTIRNQGSMRCVHRADRPAKAGSMTTRHCVSFDCPGR